MSLDAGGQFLWVRTWGGTNKMAANSLCIDISGNLYMTGPITKPWTSIPVPAKKYIQASGWGCIPEQVRLRWQFSLGSCLGGISEDIQSYAECADQGFLYVAGNFSETVDFDPGPLEDLRTADGFPDIYLSRFDAAGTYSWVKTWEHPDILRHFVMVLRPMIQDKRSFSVSFRTP